VNWRQFILLAACATGCTAQKPAEDAGAQFVATAVGRVDSAEEARQLVAAVDGVITDVLVHRGQTVGAGQVLLVSDCRVRAGAASAAQAQATAAEARSRLVRQGPRREDRQRGEANLAAAEAGSRDADDKLARAEELLPRGFISEREVTSLRNIAEQAKEDLAVRRSEAEALRNGSRPDEVRDAAAVRVAAEAEARAAVAAKDQCALRSPINGQVLQILKRQGEFSGASQGQTVAIVGDLSRLIVRAEVNERDAAAIRRGQSVEIWTDWEKRHWKGHVTELASVMGRRSARSLDPSDRFDRDVREAFIAIDDSRPPALVGLRVTVGFRR
jgi:multidrug resistance efflux pump